MPQRDLNRAALSLLTVVGLIASCGEPEPQFVHQDGTVPEIVWVTGPATELRMIQLENTDDDSTPVVWELSCQEAGCIESPLRVGDVPDRARVEVEAPNPLQPSTYDVTLVHILEDGSQMRTNNSFIVEEPLPLEAESTGSPLEEFLRIMLLQD